jgi:hypothetical protein
MGGDSIRPLPAPSSLSLWECRVCRVVEGHLHKQAGVLHDGRADEDKGNDERKNRKDSIEEGSGGGFEVGGHVSSQYINGLYRFQQL